MKSIRIAINCRSILRDQRTGIGRYTYHLLDNLGKVDRTNAYILHAPKRLLDFKRRLPDFSRYKNFKDRIDLWQRSWPKCDIYHLPSPGPIGAAVSKLVVTIHDLIHRTYPQSQTSQSVEITERYIQDIAARADQVICISENTRRDLHKFFNIPTQRISVVYNGVDHDLFFPLSEEERRQASGQLKGLGIDQAYVLYVGTIEPRKNLKGLLEGFAKLRTKKVFNGKLVVVGMKGWMVEDIQETLKQLGIQTHVIFTGFITDAQLRMLYNMAEVFVFPSFYEGFGFPILEAFSCGAPVITSKTSSCGEIAAGASLLIDPHETRAIEQALEQVLTDKDLKTSLRRAGLMRAKDFSFERMANETLEVYRRLDTL